jgi:hypothetical protein
MILNIFRDIIKSKVSKYLNFKRIKLFLAWFKIPINFKWLIAMIGYKKLASGFECAQFKFILYYSYFQICNKNLN